MSDNEFKICPFCKETIEASHMNCPHCLGSFEGQQVAVISKADVMAQADVKKRKGLAWLNGFTLLLYGYGSGALIVQGNFSRGISGIMLSVIIVGVILVAGSLFGFLAALNLAGEVTRKLAKYANLMVVGLAVFALLRNFAGSAHSQKGFDSATLAYGFILSALIALPAVLNLRAFWKPVGNGQRTPLVQTRISNEAAAAEEKRRLD